MCDEFQPQFSHFFFQNTSQKKVLGIHNNRKNFNTQTERERERERERESEKTGFCIDRGEEVIWILIKESRLVLCFVFIMYYLLREGGIDSAYF